MHQVPDHMTRSRKAGVEDVILMRLHADRFLNHIPPHYVPPLDKRSRYQVAMVIQSCMCNSYDSEETGQTDEFHFWLRTAPNDTDQIAHPNSIKFPVQFWLSLASASGNSKAKDYLQSFGFRPSILERVEFQNTGGTVMFHDHSHINWTINGRGKEFDRVNLDHVLNVEVDGQNSVGHHIYASICDPIMDQPGHVHILTDACEPFLHRGERFATVIHRMSGLEARILWHKKANS